VIPNKWLYIFSTKTNPPFPSHLFFCWEFLIEMSHGEFFCARSPVLDCSNRRLVMGVFQTENLNLQTSTVWEEYLSFFWATFFDKPPCRFGISAPKLVVKLKSQGIAHKMSEEFRFRNYDGLFPLHIGETKRKDLGMTFPNRSYIGEKQKACLRHDFNPYL